MELEIKVMWCKGLTAFNFFQKLTIYAAVSISSEDQNIKLTQQQKQEQRTVVDQEGDGNPEWNHTMKFDLTLVKSINPNFDNLSLVFEFRHSAQFFPDRTIGQVTVPLMSLVFSVGSDVTRFVSYEVRSPDGKHNGVVDFSYKLVRNVENHAIICSNQNNSEIFVSGYHQFNHSHHWDHNHSHHHSYSDEHHHIQYDQFNSGVHVSEHHHVHYDHETHHQNQHDLEGQQSSNTPEKIEYPKIDLEDVSGYYIPTTSATSLVGGNVNESVHHQYYPIPHAVDPPLPPPHLWGSPRPPHYPPQYPAPPVVYPLPQQPPYGNPHWGYHRPLEYQQQPEGGGYDHQYNHW